MTAIQARQSNNVAPGTDGTLPALTGLRGMAALMVLWLHVGMPVAIANSTSIPNNLKQFGWAGVPVFFVLSGFLITWLALREKDLTGGFRLRAFLRRRSLRIFPLYFAVVIFGLAVAHAPLHSLTNLGVPGHWALPLLTFTTNFAVAARHTTKQLNYLSVLWSVAAEVQFYVVWSICLKLFTRRRLVIIAVAAIALSLAVRITNTDPSFFIYREHMAVSLGSLMTGCLVALAFDFSRKHLRNVRLLEAVLIAAILATALAGWPTPKTAPVRCALMTIIDVECALVLILAAHSKGFMAKIFETRGMQFAGEISYPLYVFHPLVIVLYHNTQHHFHVRSMEPWLQAGLDVLLIGFVTAGVSTLWNTIERPLRRIRRQSAAH